MEQSHTSDYASEEVHENKEEKNRELISTMEVTDDFRKCYYQFTLDSKERVKKIEVFPERGSPIPYMLYEYLEDVRPPFLMFLRVEMVLPNQFITPPRPQRGPRSVMEGG